MKGKVGLVVGLSVGYVLGTRAGRERYEQIKTQWLKVWNLEPVQRQVVKAETFTKSAVAAVPGVLWEGAKRVGKAVAATQQSGPSKTTGDDVRKAVAEAADELGDVVEDAADDAQRAAAAVSKQAAAAKSPSKSTASKSTAAKSTPAKSASAKGTAAKSTAAKGAASKSAAAKPTKSSGS